MIDEHELVHFPQDLLHVRDKVEEYFGTRARKQFGPALCKKVAPELPPEQVQAAISEVLQVLPVPDMPVVRGMDLHLVFRHECLALGCRDHECTLCQFNPVRLCERNFGKKYLVGDALKAKCGAAIKVQLIDGLGQVVERDVAGVHFEVNLMDGVVYKEKGGEGRTLSEDDMKACFKLTNHRDEALLQHKNGGNHQRKIVLKLEKGTALLPDLQVTDSSEALLTGRRPPFRLLVWAVDQNGDMYQGINYAYSEEFVVATRRVKQANKAEIPLVDDHVSKIEHIGRETVKKLQDLRNAATEVGVELSLPEHLISITTVGQFRGLVELADKDVQMRKILQIVLKLSKEKWEEGAHHTMQAVVPDFRKRIWYPPGQNMGIGLLFSTKYGGVLLKEPVALVQQGSQGPVKIVPEDQLDPGSLNILRQLKAQAVAAWWAPRHPGWGIYRDPQDPTSGNITAPSAYSNSAAGTKAMPSIKSADFSKGTPSTKQLMNLQSALHQGNTPNSGMQMGHMQMASPAPLSPAQYAPQLPAPQALQLADNGAQAMAAAAMAGGMPMSMNEGNAVQLMQVPSMGSSLTGMGDQGRGNDNDMMMGQLQQAMMRGDKAAMEAREMQHMHMGQEDHTGERPMKLQRTDSGHLRNDMPTELMNQHTPSHLDNQESHAQPQDGRPESPSTSQVDGMTGRPMMGGGPPTAVLYYVPTNWAAGPAPGAYPGQSAIVPAVMQQMPPQQMVASQPGFSGAWTAVMAPGTSSGTPAMAMNGQQ